MYLSTIPALGFNFADASVELIRDYVMELAKSPYSYVVTPNVDFVVRANEDVEARRLYDGAALHICDSRILQFTLRPLGYDLTCLPGSDLVRQLLEDGALKAKFLIIGPTEEHLSVLRQRYPGRDLEVIPTPRAFGTGDAAWQQCLRSTAAAEWDILLICLGSPKQEAFASQLQSLRSAPGVALCVGASVDFLTGFQKRAPEWMQRHALEWLHRLATNPRRLFRRYFLDNPKVFLIIAQEILKARLPGSTAKRATKIL